MTTLTDLIYEVLEESKDDLMPLEVADIVKNRCSYRSFLKFIREEMNHRGPTPQDVLLHEAANNFRKIFIGWMEETFKDEYIHPGKIYAESTALIRYEGFLGGVPVFLETVTAEQYTRGGFPVWMQNRIAARAHLLGSSIAYVIIMDQNTQGWRAWAIDGDFGQVGELVKKEAKYIGDLLKCDAQAIGIASECEICPYEKSCDVEDKVAKAEPFPRVEYNTTLDEAMVTELEKHLWSLNDRSTGRKTKVIHPSELTTQKCDRCIAYGLMGIEEQRKIEPKLRRIFDMGHSAHDLVQEAVLYKLGSRCILEATARHEHLKMYGSCDIALEDEAVEIKTMSYKGHDPLNKQKPEHEDQGTIYATALEKAWLIFMYINKNTGDIKEFRKKVSRSRWHKLATRASRIIRAVGEGNLPDKINKPYICNGCKYRWYCKPEITNAKRKFRR